MTRRTFRSETVSCGNNSIKRGYQVKQKLQAIREKIGKHRVLLVILLLVVIAGGVWTWYALTHKEAETTYKTATVSKGTVTTTVSATGNVAAVTSASISPSVSGTVESVLVKAGDTVTAGQTLFTIENSSLDLAVSKASIAVQQAKQKINEDTNAITQAQENLATVTADEKSSDTQKTAAALKVSAAQLALKSDKVSLASAQQDYADAVETAAERTVTATVGGTVTALNVAVGDTVGSGSSSGSSAGSSTSANSSSTSSSSSASVTITDLSALQVSVTLNEADAVNVTVGQPVSLTFDAIDDLTLTGKVKSIDTVGTSTSNVVSYSAVLSFDTVDSHLKPGMSVSATITTAMKQDVLTVSSSAIKTNGDTKYVLVMKDEEVSQQTVSVGLVGDSTTEITSGLESGQTIVTQTITASSTATSTTTSSKSSTTNALQGLSGGSMSGGGTPPSGGFSGGGAR